jgi:hypothetical protein
VFDWRAASFLDNIAHLPHPHSRAISAYFP